MQKLPQGPTSLNVVYSTSLRKYIPEIFNLDTSTHRYSEDYPPEYNALLLQERRQALLLTNQIPNLELLLTTDEHKFILRAPKSSTILHDNMHLIMPEDTLKIENAFGGVATHHIVAVQQTTYTNLSCQKLARLDLDINHPANGVILPTDENSIYKGIIHNGPHSDSYHQRVWERICYCNTKQELIRALHDIAIRMINGDPTYTLNEGSETYNQ